MVHGSPLLSRYVPHDSNDLTTNLTPGVAGLQEAQEESSTSPPGASYGGALYHTGSRTGGSS